MAVYLHLFHGRDAIDEQLSDWGQDGPVLGPLPYVHVTYHSEIKIGDDYEPLRIIRDGFTPEKPEPRDTGYIVKYTTAEGVQITIRDQAVVNMISCLKKLIHENTGGYIASDKTIQEAQAIIEKTRPLPQMSQEIS
jgi:hypothetical protein